jgi:hypothetical protein
LTEQTMITKTGKFSRGLSFNVRGRTEEGAELVINSFNANADHSPFQACASSPGGG